MKYSAAGLCCLPVIVAVAAVVGKEGLSTALVSEAGPAAEPSDCASDHTTSGKMHHQ